MYATLVTHACRINQYAHCHCYKLGINLLVEGLCLTRLFSAQPPYVLSSSIFPLVLHKRSAVLQPAMWKQKTLDSET